MLSLVLETFAALAEPNRYRIVELLRSGPRCVNEIGERLRLSQPHAQNAIELPSGENRPPPSNTDDRMRG